MNIQVNVILDVSPKLEQLLTNLAASVAKNAITETKPVGIKAAPPPGEPAETLAATTVVNETQARAKAMLDAAASTGPAAIPIEELRALAKEKGREAVKALLDEYGYPNVSSIPEEKRAAFKLRLEAA